MKYNGPCCASSEFAKFADQWNFQHVASSPPYLQSSGKAENAVRTVEPLFTKCRVAGISEFQVLLDWLILQVRAWIGVPPGVFGSPQSKHS